MGAQGGSPSSPLAHAWDFHQKNLKNLLTAPKPSSLCPRAPSPQPSYAPRWCSHLPLTGGIQVQLQHKPFWAHGPQFLILLVERCSGRA